MSTTPINQRTQVGRTRRQHALCSTLAIVILAAALPLAPAALAQPAKWVFAPAKVPTPPAGVTAPESGVPLGVVGEISFWSPNRGLLIMGGTEEHGGGPVSSGIYAWDGVSWHQLSIVCGSAEGRIVWAGPDEFWTISDQRSGQLVASSHEGEYEAPAVSLCHFVGDEVVGSYAMPLEEPSSWRHMTGGACYSPTDCWFGGADGQFPNIGAFHLHWNGSTMTAIYEPEDHAVASMVNFRGGLLESIQVEASDVRLEGEGSNPAVIHAIAREGMEPTFANLNVVSHATRKLLPEYGKEVRPEALYGFDLAANAPAGSAAPQLWAAANAVTSPPGGSKPTTLTILRDAVVPSTGGGLEEAWSQLSLSEAPVVASATLAGSRTEVGKGTVWGTADAIAPEPDSERAWLSLQGGEGALVDQLEASTCEPTHGTMVPCGKVIAADQLPEEGEEVGDLGHAGPIVCPAAEDCWIATYSEAQGKPSGWLYHLTRGSSEEPNKDPLFDGEDGVIAYRPHDSGVPGTYTDEFAEDDSLANRQVIKAPVEQPKPPVERVVKRKAKRLVKKVTSKLLRHRTLAIAFTLTAKAHVQLVARRYRVVVAKTPRETLRPGRHTISLTLSPQRWPTKLQFEAKPIGGGGSSQGGSAGAGSEEAGSGNVVGT